MRPFFFSFFLVFNLFLIGVYLLYNVVLVPAVQHMNQLLVYMYPLPCEPPSHPSRSSPSPELSSLCYTAASY